MTELSPLPYAEREVETLAALYPSPLTFLGSAATETTLRAKLPGVDWLHLAVHGRLDPVSPLFSVLYLAGGSIDKNKRQSQANPAPSSQDGRLEVHEIFNLDLAGVNGVVLSACETGLGVHSRGDKLVGLTRAFLYAGTPVVAASLWPVEDEATAALMTSFHQHLRTGLGPAAALRAAQEEIRQTPRWSAPYYWAGFQVIGDGGPGLEPVGEDETILPSYPLHISG